jgi:hypothetical protein
MPRVVCRAVGSNHAIAATTIVSASPDESQIRFRQRVQANQFTFVYGESLRLQALCGG